MGVNLSININGWDQFVNGGMKKIFYDHEAFPRLYKNEDSNEPTEIRPSDFALWRKSIIDMNCNTEMWLRGLDALEADPSLWIYCSY
jgi:hypothetical protein